MIPLEQLLHKFRPHKNFECQDAYHITHVPSRGPGGYLHTIFKPANDEVQRKNIDPLNLPYQVREFYLLYNGAHMFSDSFSIYGFFPKAYSLDRMNRYYPYNIENVNKEYFDNLLASDIIIIGSYGYDRSEVFVEKATGIINCAVGEDLSMLRSTWPSFEFWITEEIERISEFFDEYGNQLVKLEEMLPGRR